MHKNDTIDKEVRDMAFTIEEALLQTGEQYKLKLIAGAHNIGNSINWVHMIEDSTIIQQLWGKELSVTTGLGFQSHDALMHLVQRLVKYHSVGLIINTGKYIFDIPDDIIAYCDEQGLPLITVPWEIALADLIKDFSMRCLQSEREDRHISQYFKSAFLNPRSIEEGRHNLIDTFDVSGYFQVILIYVEDIEHMGSIDRRRLSSQLEICFETVESPYSFFWYDEYFVMVINNLEESELVSLMKNMYKRTERRMKDNIIHIGIGSRMKDFRNIYLGYKRSYAAVQMATHFHYPIMEFEEMGIYQILFSIDDQEILLNMYHHMLDPLIQYDKKHKGELQETLYQYLLFDGNQQAMSKQLYMHRNTINYRLTKIKELIQNDLSSFEDKLPYMIAFYIRQMIED